LARAVREEVQRANPDPVDSVDHSDTDDDSEPSYGKHYVHSVADRLSSCGCLVDVILSRTSFGHTSYKYVDTLNITEGNLYMLHGLGYTPVEADRVFYNDDQLDSDVNVYINLDSSDYEPALNDLKRTIDGLRSNYDCFPIQCNEGFLARESIPF